MSEPAAPSVDELVQRCVSACVLLAEVGEQLPDEQLYVDSLGGAWRARLELVADQRAGEPTPSDAAAAIEAAIAESARIDDPHQSIDWLSTLPQLVLIALGERP